MEFSEENKLFSEQEINGMKSAMNNDQMYSLVEDEASVLKAKVSPISSPTHALAQTSAMGAVCVAAINDQARLGPNVYLEDGSGDGSGSSSGSNSSAPIQTIPEKCSSPKGLYGYNANHSNFFLVGKVDGTAFFGLAANKDACAGVYEAFAGWIDRQDLYKANDSITAAGFICGALVALGAIPTSAIIWTTIGKIVGYLTGLWKIFVSFFSAASASSTFGLSVILGIIIGALGCAAIFYLASMLVCGFLGFGFLEGWKVYNIFDWQWTYSNQW